MPVGATELPRVLSRAQVHLAFIRESQDNTWHLIGEAIGGGRSYKVPRYLFTPNTPKLQAINNHPLPTQPTTQAGA